MSSPFGIGPLDAILLFFLTGNSLGVPMGVPPGPEDVLILRMVPAECLAYTSWASTGEADAASTNDTEKMLADPAVQKFIANASKKLHSAFYEAADPGENDNPFQNSIGMKIARHLTSRSGMIYVADVEMKKEEGPVATFGAAISLGDSAPDLRALLEKLKEASAEGQITNVDIGGFPFYRSQAKPVGQVVLWGIRGKYYLVASSEKEMEKLLQRARGQAPEWLTALRAEVTVPRPSTLAYINVPKVLPLIEAAAADAAGLDNPSQAAKASKAFGLGSVGYVASVTGFDDKGSVSRTVVKLNGAPAGILSAFDTPPIVPADFKAIAHDSPVALVFKLNAGKVLEQIFASMNEVEPMSGDGLEAFLSQSINAPFEEGRRRQLLSNVKTILVAFHEYDASYEAFPPAYSVDDNGKPLLSWRVHILPYLGEKELYEKFHLDEPWDSAHNKTLIPLMPAVYQAPDSKAGEGKTNYLGAAGKDGVMVPAKKRKDKGPQGVRLEEITDGLALTVAVVEVNDKAAVDWTKPEDFNPDAKEPLKTLVGLRPNAFVVGYAAGTTTLFPGDLPANKLKSAFSKAGGDFEEIEEVQLASEPRFDLRKDFLASLGDTWRVYANADAGGLLTGWTISAPVVNSQKFKLLYDEFMKMDEPIVAVEEEKPAEEPDFPVFKINKKMVGTTPVYSLKLPIPGVAIAPAWCLAEKELLVGSAVVAVEEALKGGPKKSLDSLPELAPHFGKGSKPLALLFTDTRQISETLLPLARGFLSQAAGVPDDSPDDDDTAAQHPEKAIAKHLRPSTTVLTRTETGFEITVQQSLPAANPAISLTTTTAAALPGMMRARRLAQSAQAGNNLKQMGIGMLNYESVYNAWPTAYSVDANGKPLLSWRVHILLILGQQKLYEQFHLDEPWDSPHNKTLIPLMPKFYQAPNSKASAGRTNYLAIHGKDTVFSPAKVPNRNAGTKMSQITDGISKTAVVIEVNDEAAVIWTKPDDFDADAADPRKFLGGLREGKFMVMLADCSVWTLSSKIPLKTLKAIFTKSGGEAVDLDTLDKDP